MIGTSAFAARAGAEALHATTLPIPSDGLALWVFDGDKVIGIHADIKGGQRVGYLNAFSLAEPKFLWHLDQPIGDADAGVFPGIFPDKEHDQWYFGSGPLSRLDVNTGTIKWTVSCDQIGFVQPASSRLLSGDRLLLMGSTKCKQSSAYDALKEPCLTMVDTNTGKILWRYETKSLEYKLALGYWARVAKLQGRHVSADKRIQLESMLASPKGSGFDFDAPDPDRVVIAGERFEGVKLSDGTPLYKTKDKPGILRGAYDGRAFFRDGDKVTAFNGGDGAETWTFDADSKGAYVYTLDDLEDMDQGAPEDMHDIIISSADKAFRVSTATGKATWTIKRGGMSWWTSKQAFLTEGGDKVTGYDWSTGAKLWEAKIGSKPKPKDAGDFIVFIDGEKWVGSNPQPPFQISAANGKTGQVAWTKKEIDGKKIVDWSMLGTDRIRLENEKGTLAVLNIADGSPAAPPAEAAGRFFVNFVEKEKALQCRDYTGKLVWERKGEPNLTDDKFLVGHDCIVWVTKDGTEEVINRADGATLWKLKGAKMSSVMVNAEGSYMVAQNDKDLTIVKLTP